MKRLSVRFLPSPTYAALTNRQREQRRLWHFFCLELSWSLESLELQQDDEQLVATSASFLGFMHLRPKAGT